MLKNAWELRDALNHVGREGVGEGLEDVDAEEAGELFVPRTDRHEFYQLARMYFGEVSRTLASTLEHDEEGSPSSAVGGSALPGGA